MTKITAHFNREEFDCHDGTKVPQQYLPDLTELCNNLEVLRKDLGKPIHITSGYRTSSWNKKQGGAPKSQHLTARAADIKVDGLTPYYIAAQIECMIDTGEMREGGLGIYDGWVHYDIRGSKARWDYRTDK